MRGKKYHGSLWIFNYCKTFNIYNCTLRVSFLKFVLPSIILLLPSVVLAQAKGICIVRKFPCCHLAEEKCVSHAYLALRIKGNTWNNGCNKYSKLF